MLQMPFKAGQSCTKLTQICKTIQDFTLLFISPDKLTSLSLARKGPTSLQNNVLKSIKENIARNPGDNRDPINWLQGQKNKEIMFSHIRAPRLSGPWNSYSILYYFYLSVVLESRAMKNQQTQSGLAAWIFLSFFSNLCRLLFWACKVPLNVYTYISGLTKANTSILQLKFPAVRTDPLLGAS